MIFIKECKHLSVRLDDKTLKKFRFVCEYEARSANSQLLYFIRNSIREFEKEHGEIVIEDYVND